MASKKDENKINYLKYYLFGLFLTEATILLGIIVGFIIYYLVK